MPRYCAELYVWFEAENQVYAQEEMERAAEAIAQSPTTTASVKSVEECSPTPKSARVGPVNMPTCPKCGKLPPATAGAASGITCHCPRGEAAASEFCGRLLASGATCTRPKGHEYFLTPCNAVAVARSASPQ